MDEPGGSDAAPGGEQLALLAHSAAQRGTGADAAGAEAADAVAQNGDAAPTSVLPCLDLTHLRSCTTCTPAPTDDEMAEFMLVGDQGRKNGEKRLKSLLSKTPQWRSKAERASTAATCDATGYGQLARVLRNDDTSAALRKRDMIHLTRLWGYRCHIWRRRASRRCPEPAAAPSAIPLNTLAVALQLAPLLQHFMPPQSGDLGAASAAMLRAAAAQAAVASQQRADAVAAEARARGVLDLLMRMPPASIAAAMALAQPPQPQPPPAAPEKLPELQGAAQGGDHAVDAASALAALAALGGVARSAE